MALTRTRSLLAATSVFTLLAGCAGLQNTIESYGEAGKIPDNYRWGSSTANNISCHVDRNTCDMGAKFHNAVPDTVTFAFNSAQLDAQAMAILSRQAEFIRQFPEVRFKVFGHTDAVGSNGYNYGLGQRRANAVVAYLISQGVSKRQVKAVVSYGETRPVINTQDEERRNRRTVTEVSGFMDDAPLILDGKYAQVIYREYVAAATPKPPVEAGDLATASGG